MVSAAPTESNRRTRIDLLRKLMARALDPAAPEPEAQNSGQKFVKVARRDGISLEALADVFPPALPPPQEFRPDACDLHIWFGRHAGLTLLEIGRRFPQYLRWLSSDEMMDDDVREGARAVTAYLARRAAR